jgi:co-chaperonin GroES (HSP10)
MSRELKRIVLNFDLLNAVGDRIIVEPYFQPEVTEAGIMLPNNKPTDYLSGKILKIGPAVNRENLPVVEGNFVIFRANAGMMFTSKTTGYLVLGEKEIVSFIDHTVEGFDVTPQKTMEDIIKENKDKSLKIDNEN